MAYVDTYKECIYLPKTLHLSSLLYSFKSSVISVILVPLTSHHPTPFDADAMQALNPSHAYVCTNLSISHTRPHVSRRWILRTSIVASIRMATATTSLSLLGAMHPRSLRHGAPSPPLVHGRHHRLGSARLPRASAPSYNAAEDRKQQETADATTYSNDKVAIIMNPATDFFGGR